MFFGPPIEIYRELTDAIQVDPQLDMVRCYNKLTDPWMFFTSCIEQRSFHWWLSVSAGDGGKHCCA